MISAVIIRCQTPSGSYRFHAPTCSETPAQPYEEKALRRGLRAMGWLLRAQFKFQSPGRSSAIFDYAGVLLFARRWAVGGAVSAKHRPPAAVNFCGPLSRWSNALFYVCQDAKRGSSNLLKSFLRFAVLVHDEKLAEGVSTCPPKVVPKTENVVPRVI